MKSIVAVAIGMAALAGCSGNSGQRSESEMIALAAKAIESETGTPSVTISDSFFGINKGGATALCGTATGINGASAPFVVMFANGGEVADVGQGMEPATWPVFCGDDAKARYSERR